MDIPLSKPERIPSAVEIEELFTTLLDLDVEAKTITKVGFGSKDFCVLGLYRKMENHMGGLVIGDRYFSNFIGAALTRMPAESARQDGRKSVVSDTILENVGEVYNVLTSTLNSRGEPHMTLHQTRKERAPFEGPLGKVIEAAPNRIDLQITVPGYGKGTFTLILF
jgi:hypothetical protein